MDPLRDRGDWRRAARQREQIDPVIFLAVTGTAQRRARRRRRATENEPTITLLVFGVDTAGSPTHLAAGLGRLPGIVRSAVSPDRAFATIEYQPRQVTAEQILGAMSYFGLDPA